MAFHRRHWSSLNPSCVLSNCTDSLSLTVRCHPCWDPASSAAGEPADLHGSFTLPAGWQINILTAFKSELCSEAHLRAPHSSPVLFFSFLFSFFFFSLWCDKPCGQLGNFQHHRQEDSHSRAARASCQSARQQAALTGDRHTCQITTQQPLAVNYSTERRDVHSHRSEIMFLGIIIIIFFFFCALSFASALYA